MQNLNYKESTDQFCQHIKQLADILSTRTTFTIKDDDRFSVLLANCFIGFYQEIESAVALTENEYFFSLLLIARSLYELVIQLVWIKTLEPIEQQEAIEAFLNFDGSERNNNNKQIQEWYKLVNRDITIRKMLEKINIDRALYTSDMRTPLHPDTKDKEAIGIYDYLSKAAHWSPLFLREFIGRKDNQIQIKDGSHMRAIFVGTLATRVASFIFAGYWLEHFFPDDTEAKKILDQLLNTQIIYPSVKEAI